MISVENFAHGYEEGGSSALSLQALGAITFVDDMIQ